MLFGQGKNKELEAKRWPKREKERFLERTTEKRSVSPDEVPRTLTLEQDSYRDDADGMHYLLRSDERLPIAFVLELMEYLTQGMRAMVCAYETPTAPCVRALLAEYGAAPHSFIESYLRFHAAMQENGEPAFADGNKLVVTAHGLPKDMLTAMYLDPLHGETLFEMVNGVPEPVELPRSFAETERLFARRSVIWMDYQREAVGIGIPDTPEGERELIGRLRAFCAARAVEFSLLWPEGE